MRHQTFWGHKTERASLPAFRELTGGESQAQTEPHHGGILELSGYWGAAFPAEGGPSKGTGMCDLALSMEGSFELFPDALSVFLPCS